MRLLIITQKVDINDPVLGFFHRWIVEFAKHCERVIVICLEEGKHDLPENVHVLSLGKETGESRLKYLTRFYRLLWRERDNYDAVFMHMNQEYVLLGAFVWKLLGKKIALWRNHLIGNVFTRLAVWWSDKVFCTSPGSFTARYAKTKLMPVGIDTNFFRQDKTIYRIPHSILFLGRISPVKNVRVFVDALTLLDKEDIPFSANIYGNPGSNDTAYHEQILEKAAMLSKKGKLAFHHGIPNAKTPAVYSAHEYFVNATTSGSFDKTILEAMACECLVVASNASIADIIAPEFVFEQGNAQNLADTLKKAFALTDKVKIKLKRDGRRYAESNALPLLIEKLIAAL